MERELIKRAKEAIFIQDHQQLKDIYGGICALDYQLNISYIFFQLFYYACQYNRKTTIMFLFRIYYEIFSDAERVALRQGFYYGKFKIKEEELATWYNHCLLPVIKV